MPLFSLTDFVDVVSKSGTPKATKVAEVKNRPPYQPAFDFYKPLREHIVATHESGSGKSTLGQVMPGISDPKKISSYPPILASYRKWWGRKNLVWFSPPSGLFSDHGIDVSVNPELGLEINGNRHLIKLYFKADPLSKSRTAIIAHLMAVTLGNRCQAGTTMSLLDIRNSRLLSPTVPIGNLSGILSAELAYISTLWSSI